MTPEEMVVAEEVYQIFNEHFSPNLKPNAPLENFRLMSPATDFFTKYPKPIITSLVIFTLGSLAYSILHSLGFRQHVTRRLSYWFLPGDSSEPPIMYIHDIGIGYAMYLPKIYSVLTAHPGRAVILLDLPYISMLPTDVILDHDETLQALDAMFLRHNLENVSLVAHSYGTIVTSWIIQHRPQYLSKSLLVDHICFMMWDPMLAYSFLYAKPKCILHEMARFFLSTDPLINHTLSIDTYWYESVLYPERITIPTTVMLSQDDWLASPKAIHEYLEKRLPPNCNVVSLDTFHGGVIFHHEYHPKFVTYL
ncbi:hypothetical protein DSO57_1016106 [Entomophthora muscae]|uniref:Uncharacterized protein n=1 Tax=Entomophthora muscae TaxID=34485 RepID=A0ACC2TSD8_9FUNG|nr:hypothetical protein DSO57_1016106 [Entomophthora muscae]